MSKEPRTGARSARRLRLATVTIGLVLALVAAGCGDDDGGSSGSSTADSPTEGGTLSIGQYSPINSLDPIDIPGTAVAGQNEGTALYDVLIRYDEASGEFVPQLAEALTPNDDFTEWTLKLRADVRFTDGTPLDADAVIENVSRHQDPERSFYTPTMVSPIVDMKATDVTTVLFTLDGPSPGFGRVLAGQAGMIAAPSYLAEIDGGDRTATPIGAGPFKLETFRPDEVISMVRNDDYWAGAPKLERLRFVFVPGGIATVEALDAGQLDVAVVYEAPAQKKADEAGFERHDEVVSLGNVMLMNNASSSVLEDVRLREAVSKALDPKIVNDRLFQGTADAGSRLFHESSKWYDADHDAVDVDPDRAKQLVEEVKRETGWDGTIRFLCHNGPAQVNYPTTVKSLLEPVGFKVETTNDVDLATMIGDVFSKRDFDLACFGVSVPDSDPYETLFEQLGSEQVATNQIGYADPAMDEALADLRVARNDDEKRAALATINSVWNRTYPLVNLTSNTFTTVFDDNVRDIRYAGLGVAIFDQAWITE